MSDPNSKRAEAFAPSPRPEVSRPDPVRRIAGLRERALEDPESFWGPIADELHWYERAGPIFTRTAAPPYGEWFRGWKTNLAHNCLDRWVSAGRGDRVAFYWEGENEDRRTVTYSDLLREVEHLAAGMRALGIGVGDRVTIYLPLIPEAVVAMLATVRLGAVHSVVFGGFTAQALADRLNDSESKLLITADGGYRAGKVIELKRIADAALLRAPSVRSVLVVRRTRHDVPWVEGRDLDYAEVLRGREGSVAPERVESNDPSYILYTSGTTGKPKGAVHSTGGYQFWAYYTMGAVFDLNPTDVYWCTADVGWVTGHSYVVYGPTLRGATSILYEGAPQYPEPDRWWRIVARYRVSVLYTSPTAIRGAVKAGPEWPERHDLSSLRLLGTVGEPISPETWRWYDRHIGHNRCPIIDTWWQTETGGTMIAAQPGNGLVDPKPGSATLPLPGVDAAVVDELGQRVPPGVKGLLVLRRPWPGEFRTLWKDPERFVKSYFSRFPGWYYPADFAVEDADGYFWLLGRADEVMKVAGHRLSTKELEDALTSHPAIAEAAVIGRSDPIKGEVPVACVILKPGQVRSEALRAALAGHVRESVGAFAVPAQIFFVEKVPKTRSAKIMRRLIRDVVEERPLGDVTTLEDEASVEEARRAYAELKEAIAHSRAPE
jgi:acetyl-CoA synthetase